MVREGYLYGEKYPRLGEESYFEVNCCHVSVLRLFSHYLNC